MSGKGGKKEKGKEALSPKTAKKTASRRTTETSKPKGKQEPASLARGSPPPPCQPDGGNKEKTDSSGEAVSLENVMEAVRLVGASTLTVTKELESKMNCLDVKTDSLEQYIKVVHTRTEVINQKMEQMQIQSAAVEAAVKGIVEEDTALRYRLECIEKFLPARSMREPSVPQFGKQEDPVISAQHMPWILGEKPREIPQVGKTSPVLAWQTGKETPLDPSTVARKGPARGNGTSISGAAPENRQNVAQPQPPAAPAVKKLSASTQTTLMPEVSEETQTVCKPKVPTSFVPRAEDDSQVTAAGARLQIRRATMPMTEAEAAMTAPRAPLAGYKTPELPRPSSVSKIQEPPLIPQETSEVPETQEPPLPSEPPKAEIPETTSEEPKPQVLEIAETTPEEPKPEVPVEVQPTPIVKKTKKIRRPRVSVGTSTSHLLDPSGLEGIAKAQVPEQMMTALPSALESQAASAVTKVPDNEVDTAVLKPEVPKGATEAPVTQEPEEITSIPQTQEPEAGSDVPQQQVLETSTVGPEAQGLELTITASQDQVPEAVTIVPETQVPDTTVPEETTSVPETIIQETTSGTLETAVPESATVVPEETIPALEPQASEVIMKAPETQEPEAAAATQESQPPEATVVTLEAHVPEETMATPETPIQEATAVTPETQVTESTKEAPEIQVPEATTIVLETPIPEETKSAPMAETLEVTAAPESQVPDTVITAPKITTTIRRPRIPKIKKSVGTLTEPQYYMSAISGAPWAPMKGIVKTKISVGTSTEPYRDTPSSFVSQTQVSKVITPLTYIQTEGLCSTASQTEKIVSA